MMLPDLIAEHTCVVVAEIGCNHGGSMQTAKRLIDACAWAGALVVKGQKRDLASMPDAVRDRSYEGPHSFGRTYGEHRAALELSWEQHDELRQYAAARGISYSVSVWDLPTMRQARDWQPAWLKIPSACAADLEMLSEATTLPCPLVVSFGMSDWQDVIRATRMLYGGGSRPPTAYALHCTSSYPCEHVDAHLRVIETMRRGLLEDHPGTWSGVGVSGHWRGIQLDAAAVALGACIVERHVTLDRAAKGTDHAASLEPDGLRRLVRDLAAVVEAMGRPEKRVLDCEREAIEKLRAWR